MRCYKKSNTSYYVHNVLGKFSLCCILLREICENKRPLIEILDDCLYYAHNCGQVSNMLQNKRFKKKKMMFLMLPMFPYTTFVPMNERCAKRLAIRGDGWVNYESLSMTNGSQPTPTAYNYLHKQMMSFWYFICFFLVLFKFACLLHSIFQCVRYPWVLYNE